MKRLLIGLGLVCAGLAAQAHDYTSGALRVIHPFSHPTPPGASSAAGYVVRLQNNGDQADRLVGASSPAAERVELHTMSVDAQGVMRMREVEGIELAPRGRVELKPGQGYHLMLMGLRAPLKEDDRVPLTLRFERAGAIEVEMEVQARKLEEGAAAAASAPHEHMHEHGAGGEHRH